MGHTGITRTSKCFSNNKIWILAEKGIQSHLKQSRLDKQNGRPCFFLEGITWVVTVHENERISCTERAAVLLVSPVSNLLCRRDPEGVKSGYRAEVREGRWSKTWGSLQGFGEQSGALAKRSGSWKWNRFQGAEESGRRDNESHLQNEILRKKNFST